MLPVLKALSGGSETRVSEIRERVAATERLTPRDIQEMLPSGRQSIFVNRASWAMIYLGRAGLTERVLPGVWRLTAEGEKLLADAPSRIDMNYLRKYPAYVAWRTGKNTPSSSGDGVSMLTGAQRARCASPPKPPSHPSRCASCSAPIFAGSKLHLDDREMSAPGPTTDLITTMPILRQQHRSMGCFTYSSWNPADPGEPDARRRRAHLLRRGP